MEPLTPGREKTVWFRRADPQARWILSLLAPLVGLYLCQLTTLQSPAGALEWISGHPGPAVLTWLALLLAQLFVERLTDSLLCGMLLTILPCFCLSIVSHLKQAVNGTPLLISDLTMIGRMGELTGFISPKMDIGPGTWMSIFLAVILFLTAFGFSHPARRAHWRRRLAACVLLAATLGAALFSPPAAALLDGGPEGESQAMRNDRLGLLAGLYSAALQSAMQEPDAYNEDNLNRLLLQIRADAPQVEAPAVRPNVVVVVSESFFDPTILPHVSYSADPIPRFHALAEQFPSGVFLSNTYAGGTGNVEMEVFTGLPSAFLGTGEALTSLGDPTAYRRAPSIVRAFAAQGYETHFVHSYNDTLYDRARTMPAIGFDTILYQEDFTVDIASSGSYTSDSTLADQLIAQFEAKEGPIFLYGLTMENHQPYFAGKYAEPSPVTVTSDRLPQAELEMLDALVHGLTSADAALGKLTDYFSCCEEPTILIWFGDHLPGLYLSGEESLYADLGYVGTYDTEQWTPEEMMRMHSTRFLVWNNYGADLDVPGALSCTGLGSRMLTWAGLPKPLYFSWVDSVMEDFLLIRERLFVPAAGAASHSPGEEYALLVGEYRSIVYDILYGEQYAAEALTKPPG